MQRRELLGTSAAANAFRVLPSDSVLEAARAADKRRATGQPLGRLHGLPIPVKDSINTAALPTTNGTRAAFPPTLMPALPQGDSNTVSIDGRSVDLFTAIGRNVAPGSLGGLSCLVLPAGMTRSGLPVGIEFDAPPGEDRQLLALGLSLQRALGPVPAPAAHG